MDNEEKQAIAHDILTALHEFASVMNEGDFTDIGHEETWHKATEYTYWPDIFTILSYGDSETRQNLVNWLLDRIESLKELGYI